MPLALGLSAVLGACSKPAPAPEPIRAVKLITVGAVPAQAQLEYAGEVRARFESRVGFRVGGKLVQRSVDVGQRVRPGQVLAQLDAQDLTLARDAAQAQVNAAQTSRDLAAADLQRFEGLRAQNFISAAELDRRRAALDGAKAQLDQAQANLAALRNQAGYASLRADQAGVVTAVLAEPGQVLSAGAPVVQLAQDGVRDAVFALPEDKIAGVPVGSTVQVRAWSGGPWVRARVRERGASADPVTRMFTLRASLPAGVDWPLGSTLAVLPDALQQAGTPVLKLPTSALWQQGQGTAVWVFDAASSTVKAQPVQVATADGNDVVLAAGLSPGQQVVVAGVHVLAPGQKVVVYKEKSPPALTSPAQAAPRSIASDASAAVSRP
ncbi:MAG: efflux RND transporter periplasmic adaptor subunit [Rhodoferax sp.]